MSILLFSIIFVASLLAACGGAADNDEGTEPPEENEQEEAQVHEVGDTVNVDGLDITLNGVTTAQGDEEDFETPRKDEFLLIDLTVKNETEQTENVYTTINFQLTNADEEEQNFTVYSKAEGDLDTAVEPGEELNGELVYDVGESDYYELTFEDPFSGGLAIWRINKEDIQERATDSEEADEEDTQEE